METSTGVMMNETICASVLALAFAPVRASLLSASHGAMVRGAL